MRGLLGLSRGIDWMNEKFATIANWLILIICLISAGNAVVRYLFSYSSNAFLEVQWYGFAALVMLGAGYTLKRNEHVRVDLIYGFVSPRTRLWIDLFGGIVFLMPFALLMAWITFPWFYESLMNGEMSSNAGGLIRWPMKMLLPLGFGLLALQGISELIKTIAGLRGIDIGLATYERPLQ
jgi:TRAP-type mannitol/chloroaromatic compound transport system permease small subunit